MATHAQRAAVKAAHKPEVRKRALATLEKMYDARARLARIYGEQPKAFNKGNIRDTVARHEIQWSQIPGVLMNGFGKKERAALLASGTNGHDHASGVGIPLDAIPARKPKATGGAAEGYGKKNKGHPNAELIGKVIDLLATPDIDKDRADRLLTALDKLLAT